MRKRLTLEKKFNEGLEKYTKLTKDHLHKKDDVSRLSLSQTYDLSSLLS